jgi:membrane-associated phospholipid phosphatase
MYEATTNRVPRGQPADVTPPTKVVAVEQFWRIPPLNRQQLTRLGMWWCVMTVAYGLIGLVIKQWWEPSPAGDLERRLQNWIAERRTDTATRLAELASAMTHPGTKRVVVLVLLPLMLWLCHRWHDWALVTIALVFEMTVFAVTSKLVRRDRPIVEHVDQTFGWPSGHIAAAVVLYAGLAMVVFAHTRSKLWRILCAIAAVAVSAVIGGARLYLGLHYLTDAIGGAVLGALSLLVVRNALVRTRGGRPLSDPAP